MCDGCWGETCVELETHPNANQNACENKDGEWLVDGEQPTDVLPNEKSAKGGVLPKEKSAKDSYSDDDTDE